MNIAFARSMVVMALLFFSAAVLARSEPLIEYTDIPVMTGSGKALTTDQIRSAITAAAQSRNWQTTRAPQGNGLQAILDVKGKHFAVVDIVYSPEAYSIKYQSSTNLKYAYAPDTNSKVIHPAYNRWVGGLRDAIRLELAKY